MRFFECKDTKAVRAEAKALSFSKEDTNRVVELVEQHRYSPSEAVDTVLTHHRQVCPIQSRQQEVVWRENGARI
jgi:hypothetical protein